jgi:PAS domain S-box-containing protein
MNSHNQELLEQQELMLQDLRNQVENLSHQVISLIQSGKRPPTSGKQDLRLRDFISRVSARLDDEDLFQTICDEFLLELNAERVLILLQGQSAQKSIVVNNQANQKSLKPIPVPFFVALDDVDPFRSFLEVAMTQNRVKSIVWDTPVAVHPDMDVQAACARSFNVEDYGTWLVCLTWSTKLPEWSDKDARIFEEMVQYARVVVQQNQLLLDIRELRDQKDSLIASMPSAIVGLDFLGNVTMWSGKAVDYFGYMEEDVLGKSFAQLCPVFTDVVDNLMDALTSEREVLFDNRIVTTADGRKKRLQPHLFNLMSSNRGEIGLRIDDITHQVDLQEQLLHAQKMETVGTLAGGLAHDFNNILGGIIGTSSLVQKRWKKLGHKDQMDWEDIQVIDSCAQKAADLVNRLLVLSKKPETQRHPVNLSEIIGNVVRLREGSFDQSVRSKRVERLKDTWVLGESNQLENAFLNLCLNARDAMPTGGQLTIEVTHYMADESFKIRHNSHVQEDYYCVKFRDNGDGMDDETIARIFDAFYTTKSKEKGTGLGLTIVERVVESHLGYIEVNSIVNQGTEFRLFLPVYASELILEEPKDLIPEKTATKKLSVLVVDDDEVIRMVTQKILLSLEYEVFSASSGPEAVKKVHEGMTFDLVVLDVDMPGMNGVDTFKIMRQIQPSVRVLFCTGRREQFSLDDYIDGASVACIAKPFNSDQMELKVKEMLEQG